MVQASRTPATSPQRRSRRWLLLPLFILGLLALTGCYKFGEETTWIRVQNLGTRNANFALQFYDGNGRLIGERSCPSSSCPALAPGAGLTFAFQGISQFPNDTLGSLVVASDQPLAALMVSDVGRDGGAYQSAGDTYTTSRNGDAQYLPLIHKKAGPDGKWHGRFAVQNLSRSVTACVSLLYSNPAGDVHRWDPFNPFDPGPQRHQGCPGSGRPVPPGATLFRDPGNIEAPDGFSGSVKLFLHTNGQGQSPSQQNVVLTAGTWHSDTLHFGSYRGIAHNDVGTRVYLPLMERDAGGFWRTEFQVQNVDIGTTASVTVRYEGRADGQDVSRQNTFTVRGSRLCQQYVPNNDCLGPGSDLPTGFSGYAVLTANRPIAVVVNRSMWAQDWYDTYRGIASHHAATKVYLPLIVKNAAQPNRMGDHSSVRIQVADGGPANVTLRIRGNGDSTAEATSTFTVDGSRTISIDLDPRIPLGSGFVGSAILESDRPIVAVAEIVTGSFDGDTRVLYNGIPGN
jgi:hypothetical protein